MENWLFIFPVILLVGTVLFLLVKSGKTFQRVQSGDGAVLYLKGQADPFGDLADAILAIDPMDQRILFVDERAARIYGIEADGRGKYEALTVHGKSEEKLYPGNNWEEEHRFADGSSSWMKVATATGRYRGKEVLILALKKLDERQEKEREAALRKRVIDSTYNGIGVVQKDGQRLSLIDANPALIEILELPSEKVIGGSFSKLLEEIPEGPNIRDRMMEGEAWSGEFNVDNMLGEKSYQMNIDPIKEEKGGVEFFALICQDITERKASEERLLDAVIQTQKKERKRMANDLHDGVGQKLTAANVYLKAMEKKWRKGDPEMSVQHLPTVSDLVIKALEEIRGISRDLMPNPLRELGLERAIQQMVKDLDEEDMGPELSFSSQMKAGYERSEAIDKALYRASQEMLNNALRHARAEHVELLLIEEKDDIYLEVRDDGKGFYQETGHPSRGSGVRSLKERMEALGGSCEISSEPGKGTRICVRVPHEASNRQLESLSTV